MPAREFATRQNVEFPTIDGLKIRGWLFPAQVHGPAVIITPGVNILSPIIAHYTDAM